MPDPAIVTQPAPALVSSLGQKTSEKRPDLHTLWETREALPAFVRACPVTMRYLELLAPLDWAHCPERDFTHRHGQITVPYTAYLGAALIKLNEGLRSMGALHHYLLEHPGLIWLLGFPLQPDATMPHGFNTRASLPTHRHFTRMLQRVSPTAPQFLLADSVRLILAMLVTQGRPVPDGIALDTKHILAWVKENNPKAYVSDRFKKDQQPPGDPDCRLGCKRRHNQYVQPPTPKHNAVPAKTTQVGEYYWGYGSGIGVMPVPGHGEFVLAELTQPFDHGDLTYFFPLMAQVEARLGARPRYGAFAAAFDAWYVYAYFYRETDPSGGFAAIPFSEKGGYTAKGRQFTPNGLPLCAAGLAMPLNLTFTDRTSCLVEHERGRYVCPLKGARPARVACPIHHPKAKSGGCTAMMPTSIGARLRYQLDRQSDAYKNLYRQRTAAERINAQAVALGIERPHLRNGRAIANQNTLIYTLVNLRFWHRLHAAPMEPNLSC